MVKEDVIIRILSKAVDLLTQEVAVQLKVILEEELYNYDLQPVENAIIPFEGIPEKIVLFITTKKLEGLSRKTLKSYSLHLARFSKTVQKRIEDITVIDIRRYLAQYASTGIKNSTLDTEISILRSFFNWLEAEDYILKSPMRKIKPAKKEKRIRKALSQEELEMLRLACRNQREKAMIEFFYSTGCRLDEVYKLNKNDIDWNKSSVNVIGKGNKERTVFLNARARVHLWRYLDLRKDNNEALFVGLRLPMKRLSHRGYQKVLNQLGVMAGITKSVHPHLLRHTTATTAVNAGASIQAVQKMLGHTTPATTQIYADLNVDEVQISHRKFVS
ncbi:site-specific tyrosine recombinase/integron integrase [Ruminiclostridium papyrosolvens]|uniref:Integrase n=1 Tax=Ruminiclostridium papyrosolvens C7 TaxID=1330534 RepID=U4R3I0_9FIRM|nr:site-specific tyrosine recombinase/integron integrase [Ruminiclostridium papyrosolvens]EPR12316.1 integrase [Ruminiclostridium papyrosolvens C7]